MPLESIKDKWKAFGWDVKEMRGDDVDSIVETFDSIDYNIGKPHLLISKSTKGLGVSFMENVAKWHHGVPTPEMFTTAVNDVHARIDALK
jgi:transketolase